jgi:hypothetical protein
MTKSNRPMEEHERWTQSDMSEEHGAPCQMKLTREVHFTLVAIVTRTKTLSFSSQRSPDKHRVRSTGPQDTEMKDLGFITRL